MNRVFTLKQKQIISEFPEAVQLEIGTIFENGGYLRAENVERILRTLNIELSTLMLSLLPLAQQYAITPVSNFPVGAVVAGIPDSNKSVGNLFVGANFEFEGLPTSFAMHAEQSAVNNAWVNSEAGITHLAVSDRPCGCCRQFLYELVTQPSLTVLLPGKTGRAANFLVEELLPNAFRPVDLFRRGADLMQPVVSSPQLMLREHTTDPLVLSALAAANASYAPYTGGLAGCAIHAADDSVYLGRYAETAAYSPGIMPLESALSLMSLAPVVNKASQLKRVVLVEAPSRASKKETMRLVLASLAPAVTLEVYSSVLLR